LRSGADDGEVGGEGEEESEEESEGEGDGGGVKTQNYFGLYKPCKPSTRVGIL